MMGSINKSRAQQGEDTVSARRTFLKYSFGALIATSLIGKTGKTIAATMSAAKKSLDVSIEKFSAAGKSEGAVRVARVVKSDADWRKQLSPESYQITRLAGTEAPYTGKYWNNHADGLYRCICCDTALYDSKTKYESGTGWPSFWQPISSQNVLQTLDNSLGMEREAISCPLCDAHLGHVFNDGPKPTGLRYCMNSAALRFIPRG